MVTRHALWPTTSGMGAGGGQEGEMGVRLEVLADRAHEQQ
jgi:hypothetical protein